MERRKSYNFRLPVGLMEEVEKATKNKTEYLITSLQSSLHSSTEKGKDLPLQTTDLYLQPYIDQLNVWKEINQLHQNHSLAMNRIVSRAEAKVVVETQEEIKPPKSYTPSELNDFEKEIDTIIKERVDKPPEEKQVETEKQENDTIIKERVEKLPEENQVETEKQKKKGLFGFFKI